MSTTGAGAIRRALDCGVRSIEHGNLIVEAAIDLLVSRDALLVPTMSTHEVLAREGVEAGMPRAMREKVFDIVDAGKRNFPEAWRRGAKLVFGTDLLGSMHVHQLLEFALRGEFQKPIDVIRSATSMAAELFNLLRLSCDAEEVDTLGESRVLCKCAYALTCTAQAYGADKYVVLKIADAFAG